VCSVYSVVFAMHWAETPIHFIDFEGSRSSGILEFGVATLHAGAIRETHTRLCRPTGRITAEDTAIHGLNETELQGQCLFKDEWGYFTRLRETGPLAAHFSQAENHLLKSVWPYARAVPDFARSGRTTTEWGPWIDTGRLYPQAFPQQREGKLEQLVVAGGWQTELDTLAEQYCPPARRHYHAALYDAIAGAVLLLGLLHRPEFSKATVPWLLQMSTLNPGKRSALQQGNLFG
jgi:DNA polymerase III epsilon subunit-like protein